jgi:hypothetical protein
MRSLTIFHCKQRCILHITPPQQSRQVQQSSRTQRMKTDSSSGSSYNCCNLVFGTLNSLCSFHFFRNFTSTRKALTGMQTYVPMSVLLCTIRAPATSASSIGFSGLYDTKSFQSRLYQSRIPSLLIVIISRVQRKEYIKQRRSS